MPHFVDLQNNNFQLLPLVAGQDASDPVLEQATRSSSTIRSCRMATCLPIPVSRTD